MRKLLKLALPLALAGALVISGGMALADTVVWSEDWDSYPTGQDMHGMGGWKGWDSNPTWTAFTSNIQFLSSPNSIEIVGNADLVHEFAYDDGVWVVTAQQFVPSGFDGMSFFILLNEYTDYGPYSWATQVAFDSSTGMVWPLYPYVGPPLPLITDQWVEIRVEIDLYADWQSVYYNGDLLYECPWTFMYPGSNTSIAAIDLCSSGASSVYYDDLSIAEVEVCEIGVDIKPQSCPNPINVKGKGVLPVAILGTEEFDVTTVDPASVQLEGVAPLRWSLEDVATPYEGNFNGYCHDLGPDGYLDLALKFDTQELVAALGGVVDGEVLVLHLTGNLKEEFGGTPIRGEDVVVILVSGKPE